MYRVSARSAEEAAALARGFGMRCGADEARVEAMEELGACDGADYNRRSGFRAEAVRREQGTALNQRDMVEVERADNRHLITRTFRALIGSPCAQRHASESGEQMMPLEEKSLWGETFLGYNRSPRRQNDDSHVPHGRSTTHELALAR